MILLDYFTAFWSQWFSGPQQDPIFVIEDGTGSDKRRFERYNNTEAAWNAVSSAREKGFNLATIPLRSDRCSVYFSQPLNEN